jgi:hypothetical protein
MNKIVEIIQAALEETHGEVTLTFSRTESGDYRLSYREVGPNHIGWDWIGATLEQLIENYEKFPEGNEGESDDE